MDEKLGYFTYNCHEIYDRKFLKIHKEAAFKDDLGNFDLPPLAVGRADCSPEIPLQILSFCNSVNLIVGLALFCFPANFFYS